MLSRAHLIIEQQIEEAKRVPDFKFGYVNQSVFEVVAQMRGQSRSLWEDGVFQIYFKFDENYNQLPPKVWLLTIPYHPNVNQSNGQPSLDFVDDFTKWQALRTEERTIKYILLSIQQLLTCPLLDRAVNLDAVFMLKCNPVQYENIIRQSVKATHRLKTSFIDTFERSEESEAAAAFHRAAENRHTSKSRLFQVDQAVGEETTRASERATRGEAHTKPPPPRQQTQQQAGKPRPSSKMATELSFNDYMVLWKNIGTTKSSQTDENVYLKQELLEKPHLLQQHLSITLKDLEVQLNQQLAEHKNLMYGNLDFGKSNGPARKKREALKPVAKAATNYNQMKNARRDRQAAVEAEFVEDSNQVMVYNANMDAELDGSMEKEVDELIKWTENL